MPQASTNLLDEATTAAADKEKLEEVRSQTEVSDRIIPHAVSQNHKRKQWGGVCCWVEGERR